MIWAVLCRVYLTNSMYLLEERRGQDGEQFLPQVRVDFLHVRLRVEEEGEDPVQPAVPPRLRLRPQHRHSLLQVDRRLTHSTSERIIMLKSPARPWSAWRGRWRGIWRSGAAPGSGRILQSAQSNKSPHWKKCVFYLKVRLIKFPCLSYFW